MTKFLNGLPVAIKDCVILPRYFTEEDQPWLGHLVFALARFEGKTKVSWQEYYTAGLSFKMPYHKGRFAVQTLEKDLSAPQEFPPDLASAKLKLFIMATEQRELSQQSSLVNLGEFRKNLITSVIAQFPALSIQLLEQGLLLGGSNQTLFKSISELGDLTELPRRINGILIRKLMMKSLLVEIIVSDQTRRLVRQSKLRGLVCEVSKIGKNHVRLRISGPMAIFGPTTIYGRRLQEFIPLLFWNVEFRMRVTFNAIEQPYFLYLDSTSPLKVSSPPQMFDSKWENQFYLEFGKATQEWDLYREPEPVIIADRMLFPDFMAVNRRTPSESILLEVVGYWTDDYIKKKIEEIGLLAERKMIFLINSKLKEHFAKPNVFLAPNHRFVFYKRKMPIKDVLNSIEELATRC